MKVNSLDGLMLLGLLRIKVGNIHENGEGETRYDLSKTMLTLTLTRMLLLLLLLLLLWWWWEEPR